jgi:succinyl-CoA synthetase beta subunit
LLFLWLRLRLRLHGRARFSIRFGPLAAFRGEKTFGETQHERESAEEPSEVLARKANLTFIKLDGNVGCVVNGAGLAMATMDLVKYYGGEPANFLDIGGSSNPEKVVNALKIITSDPSVKGILFNIFGGITRTDDVANGIKTALATFPVKVPIVVRLTGTNEAEAVKILEGIGITALKDMDEAVSKVVKLVKEAA